MSALPGILPPHLLSPKQEVAEQMSYLVRRCVLCGAANISTTVEGPIVSVVCLACDATFRVDYGPADDPAVQAHVEITSRRNGPPRPGS